MSLGKPSEAVGPTPQRDDVTQLTPEALKAYAHPLRMAILRYLLDHGSATATTLAEQLGESTGQTSYHLRQLAKHRLIEDVPGRGTGRERWWRPRGSNVDVPTMLADEATAHAAGVLLTTMLRDRTENLGRWLASLARLRERGDLDPDSVVDRALHSESTLLLTPTELEELNESLVAIVTEFTARFRDRHDGTAPDDAVRVRAYIDVFPLLDDPGTPSAP